MTVEEVTLFRNPAGLTDQVNLPGQQASTEQVLSNFLQREIARFSGQLTECPLTDVTSMAQFVDRYWNAWSQIDKAIITGCFEKKDRIEVIELAEQKLNESVGDLGIPLFWDLSEIRWLRGVGLGSRIVGENGQVFYNGIGNHYIFPTTDETPTVCYLEALEIGDMSLAFPRVVLKGIIPGARYSNKKPFQAVEVTAVSTSNHCDLKIFVFTSEGMDCIGMPGIRFKSRIPGREALETCYPLEDQVLKTIDFDNVWTAATLNKDLSGLLWQN